MPVSPRTFGSGYYGSGYFGTSFSFAEDILDALEPMLYNETVDNHPLSDYIVALGLPFELIEDWVSDTETDIGWSLLLDVDRCPAEALPWLAQLVGLTLNTSIDVENQRQQIRDVSNWKRGTPGAIAGAPVPYLTGTKTIILRERYDGSGNDAPYDFEVITLASETTNAGIVENKLLSQKPAGDRLTYVNASGQDLQAVSDDYATLQDIKNAYATLNGLRTDTLGA